MKSGGDGSVLHEQDSKRNGETVEHLLLHCQVAQELWNMVCTLFGVHWVILRSVVELVANWSGKFNRLWIKVLWRIILHCLMWLIWRERNACTFEGIERSIHELKLLAFTFIYFFTLRDWANASGVFSFTSLPDILDFCTCFVT